MCTKSFVNTYHKADNNKLKHDFCKECMEKTLDESSIQESLQKLQNVISFHIWTNIGMLEEVLREAPSEAQEKFEHHLLEQLELNILIVGSVEKPVVRLTQQSFLFVLFLARTIIR
ncbi:hypothetical protein L1987_57701 [Smallanthus sonchifolius]|uniref:Uncharacterized protein n=1 Tax=Smallanthus sonchifolius TaxID=185202 RepID=A0ACB9DDK8_9ASTR|nr:hypothetical protein L1987_57701 [Smallanthus sonchifolius]